MKSFKELELSEKQKDYSDKEYEKLFKSELKKFKVKSIEDLSDSDKKKFFNKLDSLVKSDEGK